MEVVRNREMGSHHCSKARLVSAMVTGLPVAEALVVLKFSPRSAAVESQGDQVRGRNAEHNYNSTRPRFGSRGRG